MKTWELEAGMTITVVAHVEAETREEAIRLGRDLPKHEWCVNSELDGEPQDIQAEEADDDD